MEFQRKFEDAELTNHQLQSKVNTLNREISEQMAHNQVSQEHITKLKADLALL